MSRSLFLVVVLLILVYSCEDKKPDNEVFEIPVYRVSGFNNTRANEVSIAVNPVNTDNIIIGSNRDWFYYSFTGGYSWTEDNITSSAHGVWGDPVLIFDGQGTAYYCHLSDPEGDAWVDRIIVQKSTDGGQSWNDGAAVGLNGTKVQDKEWICSDRSNSPYAGNLYMSWTEFDNYGSADPGDRSRIRFSFSDDRSASWAEPVVISDTEGDCLDGDNTMEGAVPCVDNSGNIYITWAGPEGIYFDRSTDGGLSFGPDMIISDMPGGWAFEVPGIYRCNGMPFTVCDNSDSVYSGNIYVIWSDQRNGTDNTDIFLMRSEDGGLSWSERMMVNTGGSGSHQFLPNIAVDPLTGIIYIIYYDRSETEGKATEVWLARSADGAESFEHYRITDKPFTPDSDIFFGDYIDIDAYNGVIYPAWMQMTNREMSIWVARLQEDDFDKL